MQKPEVQATTAVSERPGWSWKRDRNTEASTQMSIWGPVVLRVMLTSALGSSRGTWQKLLVATVPSQSYSLLKVASGHWVTGMGGSVSVCALHPRKWRSRTALISRSLSPSGVLLPPCYLVISTQSCWTCQALCPLPALLHLFILTDLWLLLLQQTPFPTRKWALVWLGGSVG